MTMCIPFVYSEYSNSLMDKDVSMFKFKGLGANASTSVLPLTEKELAQS